MSSGQNVYETSFFSRCPANGVRVEYQLRIEADVIIMVERILEVVGEVQSGFHEEIAASLVGQLGGRQTLRAFHHGVMITTIRQ